MGIVTDATRQEDGQLLTDQNTGTNREKLRVYNRMYNLAHREEKQKRNRQYHLLHRKRINA